MFGRQKPVVFDPYGRRRKKRTVPGWLILLLTGIVIGAGGVVFVQEKYLPPRLSASESTKLQQAYSQAEQERIRLTGELDSTAKQLQTALKDKATLTTQVDNTNKTVESLRGDIANMVSSLPPDPRGGAVQVRAASFVESAGQMSYDLILSRSSRSNSATAANLVFVVAGVTASGTARSINIEPIPVEIGNFESMKGDVKLPEGFNAQQATIQIRERGSNRMLGMRVMYVK